MTGRRTHRRSRAGLTLIEVMLAITILGVGLTVIVTAAGRCLGVVRRARNYETARHLLGQLELTEPLFMDEIEEGEETGRFDSPYSDYQWTRTIAIEGEEEDGLYIVTTRVSWSERGTANHEEVVTYFYAPEEVEGGTVTTPAR